MIIGSMILAAYTYRKKPEEIVESVEPPNKPSEDVIEKPDVREPSEYSMYDIPMHVQSQATRKSASKTSTKDVPSLIESTNEVSPLKDSSLVKESLSVQEGQYLSKASSSAGYNSVISIPDKKFETSDSNAKVEHDNEVNGDQVATIDSPQIKEDIIPSTLKSRSELEEADNIIAAVSKFESVKNSQPILPQQLAAPQITMEPLEPTKQHTTMEPQDTTEQQETAELQDTTNGPQETTAPHETTAPEVITAPQETTELQDTIKQQETIEVQADMESQETVGPQWRAEPQETIRQQTTMEVQADMESQVDIDSQETVAPQDTVEPQERAEPQELMESQLDNAAEPEIESPKPEVARSPSSIDAEERERLQRVLSDIQPDEEYGNGWFGLF